MKPVRKRKRVVICTALAAFLALSTVGVFGEDAAADTAQDTDMPVYAENGYENPDFDMESVDYGDVDENPYSDEDIPVEYMSQEEQDAENNYVPTEEDKKAAEEGFAEEKKNMDEFFEEFDADSLEQLQSEDGLEMKLTAKSPVRLAATNVRATFHHMYYYYGEYLSCFSINRARAFCMMHFATHIGTYDGATESVAKAWVNRNYWKVLKVLYYGYTGPGYRYNSAWAEGYGYDRKATQATQLLLSEYYCSRYHPGTFNWLPHVNALRKYINSKPDFSEAAMSAKYDKPGTWKVYHYGSGDKIQTNWVTIKAGYYGFVHFTVPANTKLVFGRWQGKPCTKSYGAGTKLTMYNGDYFYLEMVNPKNSQPGSAYAYRDYFGAYQYKPYGYSPRGNTKQTMGQIEMSQVRMDLSLTRAPSYQVTVHKTDENGKTLTGAAFSLVSSGSTIKYSAGATKVNGSGNVTFSGLFPGTYVLTETTVPSGYFQTTTKYTVKIADNGAVSVTKQGSDVGSASVSGRTINVKNYKNAEIAVTKKSAAKGSAPLKGTVFTLAKGGKNITTATTDANGVARFTNLTAGTYTVKETTATKGYILNNTTYTVTIARSGTKWNITWSNPKAGGGTETSTGAGKTIYNIPYATIRGIKFETGKENVKLAGAKFTLKGTGYNQNYTTKADGSFVFEGIPEGEYTLAETAPPEDHKIIQKKYHVNITWNASQGKYDYVFKKDNAEGEVVQTTASNILPYLTEENVLHIPNTKYAEFTGVKFETTENTSPTASNLTKLQGAKFSLKGEGKSLTATSNANGEFTFKGLDSGEYEFTEISPADDNHVKNTKVYTVTVTYNGDGTYTYEFKDKETGETLPSSVDGRHAFVQTGKPYIPNVKKIEFTAVKYETWDKVTAPTIKTLVPLAGANFTLAKTGYNQNVTSGADGKVTFTKLGPGTYTLTEIASSDNHINPEREYKIKVEDVDGILKVTSIKDANGDDVSGFEETRKGTEPFVENGVLHIANKEKTKLKVVKFASWQDAEGATLSKESLHKLEGATIKLEGPNGYTAESKVTPASGEIVFEGLIPGTYTLTEEAAPNGYYSKINKYTIEVTDTGTGWAMVPKADGTLIAANVADGKRPFMVKESVEGEDVNTIYMPNVKYGELQVFKYEGIPNISETEGAVTQERVVNVTLDATLNDTSLPYLDPKIGGLKVKSITAHEATNGTTQEVQLEYTDGKGFLVPTEINGEDCDMYMVECDVNWSEEDLDTKYASWEDDNGNTYEPEGWNSKEVASSVDKSVFEANYLRDATFKLECADTGYSQTKTTAASDAALGNGYVRFEGLTPGTYTLTETVEPYKHYAEEQYKTFTVEVSETGGIYSYVIKDANGNTIDSFTQPSSEPEPEFDPSTCTHGHTKEIDNVDLCIGDVFQGEDEMTYNCGCGTDSIDVVVCKDCGKIKPIKVNSVCENSECGETVEDWNKYLNKWVDTSKIDNLDKWSEYASAYTGTPSTGNSTETPGENSVSSTSGVIDGYTAYESKADMTKVPAGTIAGNYNVGQYVPLLYVPNNKLLKLNVVKQFDGEVADADINVDFILTSVKTGEKKTVQLRGTSIGTFEDLRAGEYTLKEISYMDGWTSRKMTRNLTLDRDGTVTYPDEDDNTVVVEPVVPEP